MTSPFSVVTITGNRDEHLINLLRGVERSSVKPTEIIVVYMNQADEVKGQYSLPIRSVHLNSENALPLAEARNTGMKNTTNEVVIFLDVDCIPSQKMFEQLLHIEVKDHTLIMGTPYYLQKNTNLTELNDEHLNEHSTPHKSRLDLREGFSDQYTAFWSLCFMISKTTYETIGGFDVQFIGYGGEDTDFALSAQKTGIPFFISDARCYHQYHSVYKPPVQHVEDIVINSNYFYKKWHTWPMEGWLQKFIDLGFIDWQPASTKNISLLHTPHQNDLKGFEDTTHAY